MNDLEQYFRNNDQRLIHKWMHYFDIYDRHFSRFRNRDVVILEIGVFHGGSLQMWKHYFGDRARIYGIDINPRCKELEEENITIFIGSQSDRRFLEGVKQQIPPVDILIDDGGHTMEQQIVTFETLFDHVRPDGVYLCEDLHTSYWLTFGGGYKRRGTFIEYSKNFIDAIHAWHSEQKSLRVTPFTRAVDSLHFYDSIMVIEKKPQMEPRHEKTGKPSFPIDPEQNPPVEPVSKKYKRQVLVMVNKALRALRLRSIVWK